MNEIWKDIEAYEGLYQVSNLGRVRSYDRVVKHGDHFRKDKGKILAIVFTPEGYPKVTLSVDSKRKHVKVHRLVAKAFLENSDPTLIVNHKDGVKKNCCVDNLEWVSYSYNVKHALENKLSMERGETHVCAKLKDSDIPLIRKLRTEYGLKLKTIALIFGVHRVTINDIFTGRTWTHIKEV